MICKPFIYSEQKKTPKGYECGQCNSSGVRLYREYQTVLDAQNLYCRACALINQKKTVPDTSSEHSIGWLVAAVPTEDGSTCWGYTSVPPEGVIWWNSLPKK